MEVSLHLKQQIDTNEMPIDFYKMQYSQKLTPTMTGKKQCGQKQRGKRVSKKTTSWMGEGSGLSPNLSTWFICIPKHHSFTARGQQEYKTVKHS